MYEKFFKKLARDVYCGDTGRDTDRPECPQCKNQMTFTGDSLPYGQGRWSCSSCDFSFTEEQMNEYLSL